MFVLTLRDVGYVISAFVFCLIVPIVLTLVLLFLALVFLSYVVEEYAAWFRGEPLWNGKVGP